MQPSLKRRALLRRATSLLALAGGPLHAVASSAGGSGSDWRMPDEGDLHRCTWMSFGLSEDIWGRKLLKPARNHLANIARTIAAFEPVQMLVREGDEELAYRMCGPQVKLHVQPVDDLWMRDTGPVFVRGANGARAGVDFNFNGWGGKQLHERDAEVAAAVCEFSRVQRLETTLVLEGGGIEVDGQGTAIVTESCVLNPNRNPGVDRRACESELKRLLGLEKIIWLPGIAGKDITDGHTDFYARFTKPGVVLAALDTTPDSYDHAITRRHLELLRQARDARGAVLKVIVMPGPGRVRPELESPEFAAGYINFYLCNGAVVAPQFGDPGSDKNARAILREQYPGREVIQLNIDGIAAGGGGIHCTTQQEPA